MLELTNVVAMKSFESIIAIILKNTDGVSVALCTVCEGNLTLSQPRIQQLHIPTSDVTQSQFIIVVPKSFHQKSLNHSSSILDISDGLFNAVFGIELNLCRCPVLLLPGRGGLVLWLPLKLVVGHSASVQVLCSLADSLVSVVTLSTVDDDVHQDQLRAQRSSSVDDDGTKLSSRLVLIGLYGRVVIISASSEAAPSYQYYDILGPVCCCISLNNSHLLYSTRNDLYIASLASSESGLSMKSSALAISGVIA